MKSREESTPLGRAVHLIRRRLNETQAQFAARLGVPQSAISAYELGTFQPRCSVLILLQQLALTPDESKPISQILGTVLTTIDNHTEGRYLLSELPEILLLALKRHLTVGQILKALSGNLAGQKKFERAVLTAAREHARAVRDDKVGAQS